MSGIGFQKLQGVGTAAFAQLEKTNDLISEITKGNFSDLHKMAKEFAPTVELITVNKQWEITNRNSSLSLDFDGLYFGFFTVSHGHYSSGESDNALVRSNAMLFNGNIKVAETVTFIKGRTNSWTNHPFNYTGFASSLRLDLDSAYASVYVSFIGFKLGAPLALPIILATPIPIPAPPEVNVQISINSRPQTNEAFLFNFLTEQIIYNGTIDLKAINNSFILKGFDALNYSFKYYLDGILNKQLIDINPDTTINVQHSHSHKIVVDYLPVKAILPQSSSYVTGDSFTTANPSWLTLLQTQLNVVFVNQAQSGQGVNEQLRLLNQNYGTNPDKPLLSFVGLNNLRVSTPQQPNIERVLSYVRTVIAMQFCKNPVFAFMGIEGQTYPAGAHYELITSVDRGTSPLSMSVQSLKDRISRAVGFNQGVPNNNKYYPSNSYLFNSCSIGETFSFNAPYNNLCFIISIFDGSLNIGAEFDIFIDNVFHSHYNPNFKTYSGGLDNSTLNGISRDAVFLKGLSNGLHTIKLVLTTAGAFGFDYFAELKNSIDCNLIYFFDVPFLSNDPNIGYNYPSYITLKQNIVNFNQQQLDYITTNWNTYPVKIVDINATGYYNPENDSTHVNSDGIHPSLIGHQKILDRLTSKY